MKKIHLVFMLFLLSFQLFADKPRLAVMNFIDDTDGELSERVIKGGSKLIRSRINRKAKQYFEMVTDEENEEALAAMKKKSYRLDRDKAYQIELGRQVSASKIIIPTITYVDEEKFLITVQLIDIRRGVNDNSAEEFFDGTTDSLIDAVDITIGQLLETAEAELEENAYKEAVEEDSIPSWNQYLLAYKGVNKRHSNNAESRLSYLREREDMRESRKEAINMRKMEWEERSRREAEAYEREEAREEKREAKMKGERRGKAEAKDRLRSGIAMKKGGGALIGIGAGIVVIGGTLFGIGEAEAKNAAADGDDYEDDVLRTPGLAMLSIGIVGFVGGIVLISFGAVREKKARVDLESFAVAPTKGGMYASVGFNF